MDDVRGGEQGDSPASATRFRLVLAYGWAAIVSGVLVVSGSVVYKNAQWKLRLVLGLCAKYLSMYTAVSEFTEGSGAALFSAASLFFLGCLSWAPFKGIWCRKG